MEFWTIRSFEARVCTIAGISDANHLSFKCLNPFSTFHAFEAASWTSLVVRVDDEPFAELSSETS